MQLVLDVERGLTTAYGLFEGEKLIGIGTLCAATVHRAALPNRQLRNSGLNRNSYPALPATLLGRLAVDAEEQGRGYGQRLLRCLLVIAAERAETIASMCVLVDPKSDDLRRLYEKADFERLKSSDRMYVTMAHIRQELTQS